MPKCPECNVRFFFRVAERRVKFPFTRGAKLRHVLTLSKLELSWQRTGVINSGLHELLCNAERRLADVNWGERKTPWDFH